MDCSTPGLLIPHCLSEFAQTHIHQVSDAIQPAYSLSPSSPFAFNFSQHQGLSNELALHIRWPKYWSFSFIISPSNEYSGLISFRIDWFDLSVIQGTLESLLQTAIWKQIESSSLWSNSHIHTWLLETLNLLNISKPTLVTYCCYKELSQTVS